MIFNQKDRLGDIVTRFPKAADIFHQYQIDYCCGGEDSLFVAAQKAGLTVERLISKLEAAYQNTPKASEDWQTVSLESLIDHILQAHHAYLHENLPIISDNIKKIVRAHGQNHQELLLLYQQFQQLKTDMDMHLIKEETIQYPAIEQYLKSNKLSDLLQALDIIDELEREHTDVGDILKSMRVLTHQYHLPQDACKTYEMTLEQLKTLETNTFTHIHLENNILFPRLRDILDKNQADIR